MTKKPISGRILVLQDKQAKTESGLEIPNEAQIKPFSGIIVSVGANVITPINSKVYFSKTSGIHIDVDGVEYLLLREEDILLFETEE